MWRRVWRQRRRLILGFGLFVLVGLTVPVMTPLGLLIVLLVMPAAVTLAMAGLIAVRPRWGVGVEILGGLLLAQQLLFSMGPLLELKIREAGPLFLLGFWFFLYYAAGHVVLQLETLTWPRPVRLRARRHIRASAGRIWQALDLTPGRRHWNPAIAGVEGAAGAEAVMLLWAGDPEELRATVETVQAEDPGRFRQTLRRPALAPADRAAWTVEEKLWLEPRGAGTLVRVEQVHRGVPVVSAIRLWLEDRAGDGLDDFAAILEGRTNWSRAEAQRRRRVLASG